MSNQTRSYGNLYHVQDSDRPMWVVAESMQAAITAWEEVIRHENDGDAGDPPDGVHHVCDFDDLLLPFGDDGWASLEEMREWMLLQSVNAGQREAESADHIDTRVRHAVRLRVWMMAMAKADELLRKRIGKEASDG